MRWVGGVDLLQVRDLARKPAPLIELNGASAKESSVVRNNSTRTLSTRMNKMRGDSVTLHSWVFRPLLHRLPEVLKNAYYPPDGRISCRRFQNGDSLKSSSLL